jgi:hypothetical protein
MAKSIASLNSTKSDKPPICLLYGVDGVGKTSLAAEWPDPIYLHTQGEEPPKGVELFSPGDDKDGTTALKSYDELIDIIGELVVQPHEFKTVIIDSVDGLEPLVWKATCQRLSTNDKPIMSIEEPGYGKGYIEADTEWRYLLDGILALKQEGVAVVLLAHPEIVRFDSPVSDPYSRYGIKLQKRASALLREKSDIVGFINYRTTIKEKEVARQTKVAHGEGGGDRQIHLEERPGFLAKNRYDMPNIVPFKLSKGYAELSKHFPAPYNKQKAA